MLAANHKNRQVRVQVGFIKNLGMFLGVQCNSAMNVHILGSAKVFKVCNGKKPDIGSVVPLITQDSA